MKNILTTMIVVALLGLVPRMATAQHNDIEFGYDAGQIFLETGELTESSSDAHRLFEGAFPTSGLFERFTDDPGFASEIAEGLGVGPNDVIGLEIIQSDNFNSYLTYFDPDLMKIAATNATIRLEKGSNALDIDAISGGLFTVAQADANGEVHDHIDFLLSEGAEFGAYGILFEMTSDDSAIENSEPVWLVFNYGMDEAVFDGAALEAFGKLSAVPEPSSAMILGALGVGLVSLRRRRA